VTAPRAEQVLPPGYRRLVLLDGPMAAAWTGRPESTLRRWVHEGRVTRYGTGLYDLAELPERSTHRIPPRPRKATP
jgi:hypothetical protein